MRKPRTRISKKAIAGKSAAQFREAEHPRGPGGKFRDSGNPGDETPRTQEQARAAINRAIGSSRQKIGAGEAKRIHGLLRGWRGAY